MLLGARRKRERFASIMLDELVMCQPDLDQGAKLKYQPISSLRINDDVLYDTMYMHLR